MKTLLKVGVIVVLLLVVALTMIGVYFNSMIKAGVEAMGPKITGTTVKLDSADISPFSGQGRLKGLVVGNPPGFQAERAFKLADAKVKVDLKTAVTDKLIIEEILIDGPEITYESGRSGSNLSKIQEHVAAFGKSVGTQEGAESKPPKKASAQKKVQINDFIFKNGKVTMSTSMLGGKPLTISLPDIHLRDIGKDSGGVTPETAVSEVFKAVEKAVVQSVAKGAQEAVKSLGKAAGEGSSQVGEAVRRLFGK